MDQYGHRSGRAGTRDAGVQHGGFADMKARVIIYVLAFFSLIEVHGQEDCKCEFKLHPSLDSLTTYEFTGTSFYSGLDRREQKAMRKCMDLTQGTLIKPDQALLTSLCACETKRNCLRWIQIERPHVAGLSNHVVILFRYAKR
jgi:hypothetical protein